MINPYQCCQYYRVVKSLFSAEGQQNIDAQAQIKHSKIRACMHV